MPWHQLALSGGNEGHPSLWRFGFKEGAIAAVESLRSMEGLTCTCSNTECRLMGHNKDLGAKRREPLILPEGRRPAGAAAFRTAKGRKKMPGTKAGLCERTTKGS